MKRSFHSKTIRTQSVNPLFGISLQTGNESGPSNSRHGGYIRNEEEYKGRVQMSLGLVELDESKEIRVIVAGLSHSGKTTFLDNLKAVMTKRAYIKENWSSTQQMSQKKFPCLDFNVTLVCTDLKGLEARTNNNEYTDPKTMAQLYSAAFKGAFSSSLTKTEDQISGASHVCLLFVDTTFQEDNPELDYIREFARELHSLRVNYIVIGTKVDLIETAKIGEVFQQLATLTGKDLDYIFPLESCIFSNETPNQNTECDIRAIFLGMVNSLTSFSPPELTHTEKEELLSEIGPSFIARHKWEIVSLLIGVISVVAGVLLKLKLRR
eukprot:TRINITY_DN4475_c1_g1_i1.p1 TRINITY_DN4475_c1_g1~~TRINITY_DN4475_c1_g1_i1.p1  ORF type:complete len:323 (-),score=50.88 TRINITY_DN4475_c1_g1_i1:166-1134(-)